MSVNEKLTEELHKTVIKKFKRRKVYARFKDNIWTTDLVEMGSLSSKKKNFKYLLCVIDSFTKYAWAKDKKDKTVLNVFIEIVNESNRKANRLWFDQGRVFYNKPMQELLYNNNILMYSTYNEGKLVIAERFIKKLKAKIYKNMTVNDSKSYLTYLNKLLDQYSNTYHHSIKKRSTILIILL